MALRSCLFSQGRLIVFRYTHEFYCRFLTTHNHLYQLMARNSSLDLPSTDLFGFERARQKFLLPLSAQVSLELEDFADHDLSCPAEGDLDFGM